MPENDTVEYLQKLHPGQIPLNIFNEIARIIVTPVIEVVCFVRSPSGEVSVVLKKRPQDDVFWPNSHSVPGRIIRPNARSLDAYIDDLLYSELPGLEYKGPVYVDSLLLETKRGVELAIIYFVEITNPNNLKTFPLNNFPLLTENHEIIINTAYKSFKNHLVN